MRIKPNSGCRPGLRPFLLALVSLLLVSCQEHAQPPVALGHGYTRRGDHIYFEGGSTSADGGTRIDRPSNRDIKGFQSALGRSLIPCTNPDVDRFEALSEEYCRDNDTVFYKWISPGRFLMVELPGADAASFSALSFVFAVDDTSVWYMDQPIAGSDPASFVILNNRTGKDRNHVYVSGKRVAHLDAASFRHLASGYFADKRGVYWGIDPVAGADVETFRVLGDSFVAKDKHRTYRSGQSVEGLDAASTTLILHDPYGYQITSDRSGVYVNGLRFLHADPADFTMRDTRCGTGGRFLFFVDVYHSTPVTIYFEDEDLVAETILYSTESKQSLAVVHADVTEHGMENTRLSPPPGAQTAGTVPDWQLDIFERPDLAAELRAVAQRFLR